MDSEAILFTQVNKISTGKVNLPSLTAHDVLIRTSYSFISTGTERWALEGLMSWRKGGLQFPLVPGYQKVGYVQQVGKEVTSVAPGQRVFMTRGKIESGASSKSGGHMQYSVESENEVYVLPDTVPDEVAAGLVVIQVGWNTADRPTLTSGDVSVVIGDGIIGQLTSQGLRARGAVVHIAGRHKFRLDIAHKHSSDNVINVTRNNLLETIGGEYPDGVDIIVETVCKPADTLSYFQMLRHGGQLVFASYHAKDNLVDLAPAQDKEITCHTTGGFRRTRMLETIKALSRNDFNVEPLITHRIPWRDAPGAYERLVRDKTEESLGIVLDWTSH